MAREMALRMLYQSDLGESTSAEVLAAFEPAEFQNDAVEATGSGEEPARVSRRSRAPVETLREAFSKAREYVLGTGVHQAEIDELIRSQAENWRLERMPAVDRNILRLAVFEMLYEGDVPKLVVVDEAVELAKHYGSENSGRFVNGLLDGLLRSHTLPGSER